ncbi:MAG TPA: Cof-type HAD-IIB family hydrolase [Feifaniaceae bacterium]|nr:Cof-type HAD-IIB family hydrolase [Feifaniaceae bacterium]
MNKIRMVVSDLDGTLLDDSHRLNDDLVGRIKSFTEAGGLFTIATGRNWLAAKEIIKRLAIRLPAILCNGAVLADEKEIYYRSDMPIGRMKNLFLDAHGEGLSVLLFEHDMVRGFGNGAGFKRFREKEKAPVEPVEPDDVFFGGRGVLKAVLVGPFEKSAALWRKHQAGFEGEFSCVQSESDFLEIVKCGEDKGRTMLKLAERLGVAPGEILAIGNHMNDKEMISAAGVGAAVSDCAADLKPYADFVCSKPKDRGVLEAMDLFCGGP